MYLISQLDAVARLLKLFIFLPPYAEFLFIYWLIADCMKRHQSHLDYRLRTEPLSALKIDRKMWNVGASGKMREIDMR